MRAVWYERQGPASDVLRVGELPVPQLARWGGATVVGTVRRSTDLDRLDTSLAVEVVALDRLDPAVTITAAAMQGKLSIPVGEPFRLADAAKAHDHVDRVDRGPRERVC